MKIHDRHDLQIIFEIHRPQCHLYVQMDCVLIGLDNGLWLFLTLIHCLNQGTDSNETSRSRCLKVVRSISCQRLSTFLLWMNCMTLTLTFWYGNRVKHIVTSRKVFVPNMKWIHHTGMEPRSRHNLWETDRQTDEQTSKGGHEVACHSLKLSK